MKVRIVAAALLAMVFSVGLSQQVSAHPWGGHRAVWGRPHVGIRVIVPPIPVPAPVVVGGYYNGGYYANGYCGRDRDRYYGRGYYEPVPAYRGYYNRGWEHRENFDRDHRGYRDDRHEGGRGYYGPRGGRR